MSPTPASPPPCDTGHSPAAEGTPTPGTPPPPTFDIDDRYLRAADEAGLLHRVDGLPVVAGEYAEPASGELQLLVEHADPTLLARAPRLLEVLFRRHPDCTSAVVRVPAHLPTPPGLLPLLGYLRHTPGPPPETPPVALRLTEAAEADRAAVGAWLARAIRHASADRGHTVTDAGTDEAVRGLLDAPGRRSYLVRTPGAPAAIGHATVLTDAHDDVSDTGFVDLVDILVDDDALRRAATAHLVAACAATAAALGRPLIGNVTHPVDPAGRERAAGVVASLRRQGWTPTHGYAHAPRP
ncbi:hypothetical protein ACGFS9_20195 [Streptomyces sp. NPDC048566]|uniref:hypothetical protein n=1 Tax=Streptomyces sp. NPDC048566 TaxID=3365569 RepID=UPI00371C689E